MTTMLDMAPRPTPSRMYSGYNHTVPIAGEPHDVQTEFVDGDPPKIVSHAFVHGRVVASHISEVGSQDLEDEFRVRELIKRQQKETIRQLVVSAREHRRSGITEVETPRRKPTPSDREARLSVTPPSERPLPPPRRRSLAFADVEMRKAMVRFSRAARAVSTEEPTLDHLTLLINQSASLLAGRFDASRSDEAAELLLVRAESIECIQVQDGQRAPRLVDELRRLARAFASINQRAELQDHDHEEWQKYLARLESLPEDGRPSADDLRQLRSTWGRDVGVDRLLDDPGKLRNGPLRAALVEALRQLEADMRDR